MSTFWWAVLFGFVAVAAVELVAYFSRGSDGTTISSVQENGAPTASQRVQYWVVCAVFVMAPVLAAWVAVEITRVRVWGVALLLLAGLWFALGIVVVSIPLLSGCAALKAFVASIERQSHTSFRALVRLWIIAVIVAAVFSVRRLSM